MQKSNIKNQNNKNSTVIPARRPESMTWMLKRVQHDNFIAISFYHDYP